MRRHVIGLAVLSTALGVVAVPAGAAAADRQTYVVMLADGVPAASGTVARLTRRWGADQVQVWASVNGFRAEMTAAAAAEAAAVPEVASVRPDGRFGRVAGRVQPISCQELTDPAAQCLGENVDRVDGDRSGTRSGDGRGTAGVNIAIIDSGVDRSHPDLNVVGGVDCSTGSPVEGAGAFRDRAAHGTLVAGVAAARDNDIGVVGAAPGAPLWSVKVDARDGSISDSAVLCAVDWVTRTRRDAAPGNDIAVANMSLGDAQGLPDDQRCGQRNGDALHTAICRSVRHGVTYVAAAGNDATDLAGHVPAAYEEVLAVTAMSDFDGRPGGRDAPDCYGVDLGQFGEADDAAATYSNLAVTPADRRHTIAAPGTCVESTSPLVDGFRYAVADGTSFAAPLVSGTAALCIASGRCPAASPARTTARLLEDAAAHTRAQPGYGFAGDPLRPVGERYYGFLVRTAAY